MRVEWNIVCKSLSWLLRPLWFGSNHQRDPQVIGHKWWVGLGCAKLVCGYLGVHLGLGTEGGGGGAHLPMRSHTEDVDTLLQMFSKNSNVRFACGICS
jgi:hypothetical protein